MSPRGSICKQRSWMKKAKMDSGKFPTPVSDMTKCLVSFASQAKFACPAPTTQTLETVLTLFFGFSTLINGTILWFLKSPDAIFATLLHLLQHRRRLCIFPQLRHKSPGWQRCGNWSGIARRVRPRRTGPEQQRETRHPGHSSTAAPWTRASAAWMRLSTDWEQTWTNQVVSAFAVSER